jgi:hypothetical protein
MLPLGDTATLAVNVVLVVHVAPFCPTTLEMTGTMLLVAAVAAWLAQYAADWPP